MSSRGSRTPSEPHLVDYFEPAVGSSTSRTPSQSEQQLQSYRPHAQPRQQQRSVSAEPGHQEDTSTSPDDWSSVTDPLERRKIQNRIAQREFRKRSKLRKQGEENAKLVSSAYTRPPHDDFHKPDVGVLSGVPWGSMPLGPVDPRREASEPSTAHPLSKESTRTGSSQSRQDQSSGLETAGPAEIPFGLKPDPRTSSLGLRLTKRFALGTPAWRRHHPYHSRSDPDMRRRS